jgi:hypothetical protein
MPITAKPSNGYCSCLPCHWRDRPSGVSAKARAKRTASALASDLSCYVVVVTRRRCLYLGDGTISPHKLCNAQRHQNAKGAQKGSCGARGLKSLFIGTHTLRAPVPIDSSMHTHQAQNMCRPSVRQERCAHTTKTGRRCPRVTQAAMIAAASFGLRRSGTLATATSGAALGRISEAWPALAPPGECSLVHFPKLASLQGPRTQWAPLLPADSGMTGRQQERPMRSKCWTPALNSPILSERNDYQASKLTRYGGRC